MSLELEAMIEAVDDGDRRRRRRRDDDGERDAGRRRRRGGDDDDDEYDDRRRRRDADADRDGARRRRRDDDARAEREADRRRRDDGGGRDRRRGEEERRDQRDRDRDRGRDRDRDRERAKSDDSLSKLRPDSVPAPTEMGAEEKMARAIERDKRTVFVSNLHPKVDDFEIFEFFSKAGKVRDVRLITDKNGKSKGFGYVEFYDPSSVAGALNLQGMEIQGHPCMVKLSESEKNLQAAVAQAQMVAQQQSTTRLYVGNLSPKLTEDEIHEIFDKLGPIEHVQLTRDPAGGPNSAYVKYRHQDDAKKALSHLNGKEMLDGLAVKIGLVNEAGGGNPAGGGGGGALDDEMLNARGRQLLMAKLAGGEAPPLTAAPVGLPPAPGLALSGGAGIGEYSCIHLSNLFDPAEEEDEDFDEDIKEEVADQCNKLGRLMHIFVDKHSPKGEVWLRFADNDGGRKCHEKMADRWFAKRQIRAEFVPPVRYIQRFPNS